MFGDDELAGDAAVGAAFGHQLEDLPFAWRELSDGVVALAADELCDDGRVDRGATAAVASYSRCAVAATALTRIDERVGRTVAARATIA